MWFRSYGTIIAYCTVENSQSMVGLFSDMHIPLPAQIPGIPLWLGNGRFCRLHLDRVRRAAWAALCGEGRRCGSDGEWPGVHVGEAQLHARPHRWDLLVSTARPSALPPLNHPLASALLLPPR